MDAEFKEKYPEHAKLDGREEEHKNIQSFCMFLQANNLLNRRISSEESGTRTVYRSLNSNQIAEIIGEYFDINYQKYMREKDKMLTVYIFVSRTQQHVRVVYRGYNSEDIVENHKPATIKKNGGQVNVHPIKKYRDNSPDEVLEHVTTVPTSRTIIKYVEHLD